MYRLLIPGSILFFLLFSSSDARAESPGALVEKGNQAYAKEKYDDALSSYEEALKEAPDSPHVFFNKGTAHYKKGEFDNAANAFEKSADRAEDKNLEAKARFNQGNALLKKAKSLIPSDLNGALEKCKKSIQDYREALELEPGFAEAAENIETGRLTMKSILDQMEQQKEQSKEDQSEGQGQDKDQEQNQDQNQDSEKKKPGESDDSENEEGEPGNQESSEDDQSGSNDKKNQDMPEKEKQEKIKKDGSEKEQKDISDMIKADAESILDEEKENKERRRAKGKARFTDVDRDW